MNTTILEKVIAELKNEKPDLSYIRGMIETLLEMQPKAVGLLGMSTGTSYASVTGPALKPSGTPPFGDSTLVKPVDNSPSAQAVDAALASIGAMPTPKPGVMEKNTILN